MAKMHYEYDKYNYGGDSDIGIILSELLKSLLEKLDASYGFCFVHLNVYRRHDTNAVLFEHVYSLYPVPHYYSDTVKSVYSVSESAMMGAVYSKRPLDTAKNIGEYIMSRFRQDVEHQFNKKMHCSVKGEKDDIIPKAAWTQKYMSDYLSEPYSGVSGIKSHADFAGAFEEAAKDPVPEKKKAPVKKQSKKTVMIAVVSEESTKNIAKNLEL